jgi:hypothetical protein
MTAIDKQEAKKFMSMIGAELPDDFQPAPDRLPAHWYNTLKQIGIECGYDKPILGNYQEYREAVLTEILRLRKLVETPSHVCGGKE